MRDATATQPRAVTSRRQVALLFSILLPLLLVFGSLYIHRTSFVVNGQRVFSLWDDAMISMEYARNLSEGHGLVWNAGGERVWGFTNLGVTLTMALLHVLPLNEFTLCSVSIRSPRSPNSQRILDASGWTSSLRKRRTAE